MASCWTKPDRVLEKIQSDTIQRGGGSTETRIVRLAENRTTDREKNTYGKEKSCAEVLI